MADPGPSSSLRDEDELAGDDGTLRAEMASTGVRHLSSSAKLVVDDDRSDVPTLRDISEKIEGAEYPLVIEMPEGDPITCNFRAAQTIEQVKLFLITETEDKYTYPQFSLYFGDKILLDPLSLSDLPILKAGTVNRLTFRLKGA